MDAQSLLSLGSTLMDIDEARFRQVVGLLERMGDHPDVQKAFSVIRPRMAELRPKRRPTFKRLYCTPFEDLFEAPSGHEPAPMNRIERGLVSGLWRLVEERIGADRLAAFRPALQGDAAADPFWAAAAAVTAGIAGEMEAGRLAEALDIQALDVRAHPDRLRQVRDIARILAMAPAVQAMKEALAPRPLARLHQEHLEGIQAIGRGVARTAPESLRLFVLLAAARLSNPSILLGALWSMDMGQSAGDRAALFLALSDTVVAQIEDRSRAMARGRPGAGPAEAAGGERMAVADLAVDLVASLEATRAAMEQSRSKEFDQRLRAVRGSVHDMVRRQVLEGAQGGILAALAAPPGGDGRQPLLDAEDQARALRKCATIADTLGLRGALKAVTQTTTAALADRARQALGGGDAGEARAGYTALRMIELMAGSAEATQIMEEVLRTGRR